MKNQTLKKLTLSAMFLALGLVLPFLTGQIQLIGNMLLPMHIPVFLCALICGWQYGVPMAIVLPVFRSFLFGMPPMYPTALSMSLELAAYAFTAGYLYEKSRWQCLRALYRCLLISMISGRIVWGAVMAFLLGFGGKMLTLQAFLNSALLYAIPGIVLQLILIPAVMVALDRAKVVPFRRNRELSLER